MKTYTITINYEREIEADDEDDALVRAEEDLSIDNDSLWHYAEVKEIK